MSEVSSAPSSSEQQQQQQQQSTAAAVKHITVYKNGDAYFSGRRFVVNAKQVGSYENLLGVLTRGLGANFGAVRSVFTPRGGHRLSALGELSSGGEYVATGTERFKKLSYKQNGAKKENPPRKETNSEEKSDLPSQPRRHRVVSSRWKRPTEEPITIFVFTNGDAVRPAVRILLTQRILGNWENVLKVVTDRVDLRTGAARRLCTLDGTAVMSGSFLESGLHYVAVGKEKFRNLPYGEVPHPKYFPQPTNGPKPLFLPPIKKKLSRTSGRSDYTANLRETSSQREGAFSGDEDRSVFQASESREDNNDVTEVSEDKDTKVELPIDQLVAEIVEEEMEEECHERWQSPRHLVRGALARGRHDSPPNSPRDSPKDCARNYLRDSVRDSPRDNARASPNNRTHDSLRRGRRDSPDDSPRDSPRDSPNNRKRDSPRRNRRDSPDDSPRDSPRNSPRNRKRDSPRRKRRDSQQKSPRNSPTRSPREYPRESSRVQRESPCNSPRSSPREPARDSPGRGLCDSPSRPISAASSVY
ncbi:doublecortin domain-containing protein 2-like isoform X1 [Petromyzon marinus]|uniref:doublecortin domain-containing protein 2-like isoform X1 n=1 Tax=Petromyzon marinus TaxID=7757 RepID=UPI003F72A47E